MSKMIPRGLSRSVAVLKDRFLYPFIRQVKQHLYARDPVDVRHTGR